MGYLTSSMLDQTLTYEAVSSRAADGTQDRSYANPVEYDCREEIIAEMMLDSRGVEVMATSLVFIEPDIFATPDIFGRYTLPSGDVVRLVKAEAVRSLKDSSAGTIVHWEAYFTRA
jgi:hypothetical protein